MYHICSKSISYIFAFLFIIIIACEIFIGLELPKVIEILDDIYNYKIDIIELTNCQGNFVLLKESELHPEKILPFLHMAEECYIDSYNNVTNFEFKNRFYLNINYEKLKYNTLNYAPITVPKQDILSGNISSTQLINKWSISVQPSVYIDTIDNILNNLKRNIIEIHFVQYAFIFALFILIYIYHKITNIQSFKLKNLEVERLVLNQLCHELRTSLVPVEMYTRELLLKINDNGILDFINNNILMSIKQHAYVLKSRLDFDKIMNNNYTINNETINLLSFTQSILFEINQYIMFCNKSIKTNIECYPESIFIEIDVLILRYILLNILRNSVKYCDNKDTINIVISIKNRIHNKQYVEIMIIDSGKGLSKHKLQKVQSTKKKSITEIDSYGLGIPFVKKLISIISEASYNMESEGENKGLKTILTFLMINSNYRELRYSIDDVRFVLFIVDDCIIVQRCLEKTIKNIFGFKFKIHCLSKGEDLLEYKFLTKNIERYIHIIDENMESSGGILKGSNIAYKLKQRELIYDESHHFISISGNNLSKSQSSYFDFLWEKPPPSNDIIQKHIKLCCMNSADLINSSEFIQLI